MQSCSYLVNCPCLLLPSFAPKGSVGNSSCFAPPPLSLERGGEMKGTLGRNVPAFLVRAAAKKRGQEDNKNLN